MSPLYASGLALNLPTPSSCPRPVWEPESLIYATSQNFVQRIIEREGLDVDVAVNGAEAVEKAQKTLYDIILMDCIMPIKDGWQATGEIREWERTCGGHGGKRVPIIAVTAHAMCGDRERCIDAG